MSEPTTLKLEDLVLLRSNWKSYDDPSGGWSMNLGPLNLFCGPTGSGKSRVPEAMALLWTGRVPGYLGRPNGLSEPKALWRARPGKAKGPLYVEAQTAEGGILRWEQARSNGRPTWTFAAAGAQPRFLEGPPAAADDVLGISEVRAALFGSPEKAERWLAERLGLTPEALLQEAAPPEAAPQPSEEAPQAPSPEEGPKAPAAEQPPHIGAIRAAVRAAPKGEPGAVVAYLEKKAKEAASEATTAAAVVEEIAQVVGAVVTDGELEEAKVQVAAASQRLAAVKVQVAQVGELTTAFRGWNEAKSALSALPGIDPHIVKGLATAKASLAALRVAAENFPGNEFCACCRQPFGVEALKARAAGLEAYIASASEAAAMVQRRSDLEAAAVAAKAEIQRLMGVLPAEVLGSIKKGAYQGPALIAAAETVLRAAEEALDELQKRRIATQAPGMAQESVTRARERATMYTAAAEAAEAALTRLVERHVGALNMALAERFPPSLGVPKLTLRPAVELGIDKGGIVAAPSGGEETLLLLAVAHAFAAQRGGQILLVEDRQIDPTTMASALRALVETGDPKDKVFVTLTYPLMVEGWTITLLGPMASGAASQEAASQEAASQPSAQTQPAVALPIDIPSDADLDNFLAAMTAGENGNGSGTPADDLGFGVDLTPLLKQPEA